MVLPYYEMLSLMLQRQEELNAQVHPEWRQQDFNWTRAVWLGCAGLMGRLPWKWWGFPPPDDTAQVQLELVDIFHFGLSAILQHHGAREALLVLKAGYDRPAPEVSLVLACERIATVALAANSFAVVQFRSACAAAGLSDAQLFRLFMGKPEAWYPGPAATPADT